MDQVEKKIIETLKSLRNDPDFGASLDVAGIHRRAMIRNGFHPDATKVTYTLRDYLETYLWQFTHTMLKPMAATLAVFLFSVVGSVSVVGASAQALPGDTLYPVKLTVEKVQLSLALSDQSRADLRVEFAGRRLEEMVALAANVSTPQSVQLAADRFKTEVNNIQVELSTDGDLQKEFAKTVGRKVEVYSSTVATTNELPEEVVGQVEEVLEETKEQVVEVIITAHEEEQDEATAHELDEALSKEVQDLDVLYGEDAYAAIATAEALRAEGLYRRAFQVLKDFRFEAELQLE